MEDSPEHQKKPEEEMVESSPLCTGVFLTIGDGAETLGAGAYVGDFDGECDGDWAKVDIEENPSFNTPSCLQVSDFTLAI